MARSVLRDIRDGTLGRQTGLQLQTTNRGRRRVAPVAETVGCSSATLRGWSNRRASEDGRVEIESNSVETLIRSIAFNRKNVLFAGHDEGSKAWGRVASLIETAKVNNVEPFTYLKATLEAIARGHPQDRIDDLLSRKFQPSS